MAEVHLPCALPYSLLSDLPYGMMWREALSQHSAPGLGLLPGLQTHRPGGFMESSGLWYSGGSSVGQTKTVSNGFLKLGEDMTTDDLQGWPLGSP